MTGAERTPAKSASTTLVGLALERFRLGVDRADEPFAVALTGPQIARPLRGGKDSLRAELAALFYVLNNGKQVAPQQALADACATLEGIARGQDPETLHVRTARHGASLYVDLGDRTGRSIRIGPDAWEVIDRAPVLFRRSQLTGALPTPEPDGDLGDLWSLLNVTASTRTLLLAWLISALEAEMPHPVLVVRGEQGTGKTKGTKMLAGIIDPSPAQTRKPPRDVDAWVTAASGSWVVAVDNVSDIPDWWSDALCRAVTGDGDVRRLLYTPADLSVFAFRRVIILNGIDLGAVRDDLSERLLTIELDRIPDSRRRLDADMDTEWLQAHPRILGALLDLTVRVLAEPPRVHLQSMPRMADFARILSAVDQVLGDDGLARYCGQAGDLAADAMDADPVLAAIKREIFEPWEGPAGDLLLLITPTAERWRPPKGWPKDARALTGILRRRAPSLRRLGWTADDLGRGGRGKVVRFRLIPPSPAGDSAGDKPDAGDAEPSPAPDARTPIASWPAETPVPTPNAGDAGDKYALSLSCLLVEKERTHPHRDSPQTSPATPATPDEDVAGRGPCALCRQPFVRHGDRANGTLCRDCSPVVRAVAPPGCRLCSRPLYLVREGRDVCEKCRLDEGAA